MEGIPKYLEATPTYAEVIQNQAETCTLDIVSGFEAMRAVESAGSRRISADGHVTGSAVQAGFLGRQLTFGLLLGCRAGQCVSV